MLKLPPSPPLPLPQLTLSSTEQHVQVIRLRPLLPHCSQLITPSNARHCAQLPLIPGEGVYTAPLNRGRPALLAACKHLCVLLLMLAQHLGDRDQGLDLGHLLADVHQLSQVRLTDVMHGSKVTSRVTLHTVLVRIGLLSHRGEMVKKHHHALLILQDEGVDNLHVRLLAPKLHQVGQIL